MLSFALLTGLFLATPLSAVDIAKSRWVTSWTAMPQDTDAANMPPAAFIDTATNTTFFNTTIRQTVRVSLGGEAIRVRFANTFGTSNLVITAASIALPVSGSGSKSVHLNTSQALTFAGSTSFSVPVGGLVVSDPLEFGVAALETISVSVYLASGHPGKITSHPGSFTTSWLQWGNSIHEENLTDASVSPTPHWFLLNAVEVFAPDAASALFLVGDSITDGFGSDMDANNRQVQRSSSGTAPESG
ncbi:Extracellular GDSL-like lipase/acylhydrolase [Mycena kentingensis (nom. inval.)]|nr:Extracellular GDSL-like lipase/acylhydrolase [Mycena kentingensis (nom. inval.)]